ncbi:MAG: putative bifunctional diguanylate cyclase/phosphodiesterase, partial [Sphingomonadaceae bacterium]
NTAVNLIMGAALLLVWRRHTSQTFARDLGYSTVAAAVIPLGYLLYTRLEPPAHLLGVPLVLCGAISNLLLLTCAVLRLADRRLRPTLLLLLALVMALLLTVPSTAQRVILWPSVNLCFFIVLGSLTVRWTWHTQGVERLVGPLLLLLGATQLPAILYGEEGHAANLFGSTAVRVAIGCVFLFAALERAACEMAKLYQRFQLLTEHSLQGVVVTDGQHLLYANPAAHAIYGNLDRVTPTQRLQDMPSDTINAGLLLHYHQQLQQHELESASWEGQRLVADGQQRELRFAAWRIEWDGVPATQILITDDTERNASARALLHKATHDELTGLPNRSVLMDKLVEYCEPLAHCTLVVLNIDRCKLCNPSQGPVIGDQVLQAFAQRLKKTLGTRAQLVRLGGDEFAVVDPDPLSTRDLSWRLHGACRQVLTVPSGEYYIDASMGMAIFPDHAGEPEDLLRAAIAAMFQAKRTPGTALTLAERRSEQQGGHALEQEQALRKAILSEEIFLDYQPKVDAASGKLLGFEALARWRRPGIGLVSPIEFIGVAEQTGMITELGALLLSEACRQIAEWRTEAGDCVPVAVNVSPVQLLDPGFLQLVEDALQRYGVPPRYLTLEITESAAVDNLADTQLQLQQLRELGVDVAMDDFGTGFSSLSMLRELPLRVLKIDRGLIDPLPAPDAVAVVEAICQLAAALNLQVVAEGIETEAQANAARAAGCHELQGYYYARPLPAPDAADWLRRNFGLRADGLMAR